jgi:hypothetical protein
MSADRSENLRLYLGFENAFGVNSEGQSSGLVIMWRKGIIVHLKYRNRSHIDTWVCNDEFGGVLWRFTGF